MKKNAKITLAAVISAIAGVVGYQTIKPPPNDVAVTTLVAAPIKPISWDLNSPNDRVLVYRVFDDNRKLVAEVAKPPFTPTSHGRYRIKAVNARGESKISNPVRD